MGACRFMALGEEGQRFVLHGDWGCTPQGGSHEPNSMAPDRLLDFFGRITKRLGNHEPGWIVPPGEIFSAPGQPLGPDDLQASFSDLTFP